MQSGISVSKELQAAFNEFTDAAALPNPLRGIVASIKSEQIIPIHTIPSRASEFLDDVGQLEDLIADEAAYIILRRYDGPDGLVAVTYVPDSANVREKMLFASTRLTLVRELGAERFRETLFATTKAELTATGWRKHDTHDATAAPLTEEERSLRAVKAAEAEASRGTTGQTSHVAGRVNMPVADEAIGALRSIGSARENLVQWRIDVRTESIELANATETRAESLAGAISDSEPRYSFFRYDDGDGQGAIVFIYTCPPTSSIKERMVYASTRRMAVDVAGQDAGINVAKRLEASSPSEISAKTIEEEFVPKVEKAQAFARPKKPGKRT